MEPFESALQFSDIGALNQPDFQAQIEKTTEHKEISFEEAKPKISKKLHFQFLNNQALLVALSESADLTTNVKPV